jgi:hypothetical protein
VLLYRRYPYPAWVAGTVYDPESGNIIIDMRIINPQDTRQLLDLALAVCCVPACAS